MNNENEESSAENKLPDILKVEEFFKVESISYPNVTAKCLLCNESKKGNVKSTGNFRLHYKRCHPDKYDELDRMAKERKLDEKNKTMSTSNSSNQSNLSPAEMQLRFENDLLKYVIMNMQTPEIVDNPQLTSLIHGLQSKIHIMDTNTLQEKIKITFNEVQTKIKTKILSLKHFGLTIDILVHANDTKFLVVFIYWINAKLLREYALLHFENLIGEESPESITNTFFILIQDYEITTDKIDHVTTNNLINLQESLTNFGFPTTVSNVSKSYSLINIQNIDIKDFCIESMKVSDNVTYELEKCFDDVVELFETDAIETIHNTVILKCIQIWNSIKDPENVFIMKSILKTELKTPSLDSWVSLFEPISEIIKNKDKINPLISQLKLALYFNEDDWRYLKELESITNPLLTAIKRLNEEPFYHSSVLPVVLALKQKMLSVTLIKFKILSPLADKLYSAVLDRFEHFYSMSEEVHDAVIATTLHPYYKLRWLPQDMSYRAVEIKNLCVKAVDNLENTSNLHASQEQSSEEDDFLGLQKISTEENNQASLEVMKYLGDKNKNLDVLNSYPLVKQAFSLYNLKCPSSMPVKKKLFANDFHNSLKFIAHKTYLKQLVFLNVNYDQITDS